MTRSKSPSGLRRELERLILHINHRLVAQEDIDEAVIALLDDLEEALSMLHDME